MVIRRAAILVSALLATLCAALALYLSAAIVLGLIPVNRAYRPASGGIDVYLRSNGVHADIILPVRTRNVDWAKRLPLQHLHFTDGEADHLSFGWGDRGFYIGTPTWSDLRLGIALMALTGLDTTVLHVEAGPIPIPGEHTRRIWLSDEQYERLAMFINASFRRTAAGATIEIPGAHYGRYDAFFEAEGHYSARLGSQVNAICGLFCVWRGGVIAWGFDSLGSDDGP